MKGFIKVLSYAMGIAGAVLLVLRAKGSIDIDVFVATAPWWGLLMGYFLAAFGESTMAFIRAVKLGFGKAAAKDAIEPDILKLQCAEDHAELYVDDMETPFHIKSVGIGESPTELCTEVYIEAKYDWRNDIEKVMR